ncbi:MAG: D-amino acid aminotransferase [Pseudomonadota bacterium]
MTTPIAYLNGQWLPLSEARVSVLDRGFLFADGVYEVLATYDGRLLGETEHLARLERSLGELKIRNPHTRGEWQAIFARLIREAGGGDLVVYLQITRGAANGRSHAFPDNLTPTVVAYCSPLPSPSAEARAQGVSAITAPDPRWARCDIKSISLLANVLLTQQAKEAGANEAILHRDGRVTEGSSSNVFIVRNGTVLTTPDSAQILSGVTRNLLAQLQTDGVQVISRGFSLAELRAADEIWITSTTREVLAITILDGKPVGNGKPGKVYARAYELFQTLKRR